LRRELPPENIAWFYVQPLHDAARVAGRIAFFDERVDVDIDGEHLSGEALVRALVSLWGRGPKLDV